MALYKSIIIFIIIIIIIIIIKLTNWPAFIQSQWGIFFQTYNNNASMHDAETYLLREKNIFSKEILKILIFKN